MNTNHTTTRRAFLKQSGTLAAGSAALGLNLSSRAADANGRLVLGIIGPGGMGMNHIRALAPLKDVAIAYVCDPDENRRNKAADETEKLSGAGARPHADIEIGHYSGALCHLGNIATRLGRTLRFDPKTEMFLDDPKAAPMVRRTYRPGPLGGAQGGVNRRSPTRRVGRWW